jgi:hypothetical protein
MKKFLIVSTLVYALMTMIALGANESARNDNSGDSTGANTVITVDTTTGDIFNVHGDKTLRAINVRMVGAPASGTILISTLEQACTIVGPVSTVDISPAMTSASSFSIAMQDASGAIYLGLNGSTASTGGFPIYDSQSLSGNNVTITSVDAYNKDTVSSETVCVIYGSI